MVTNDYILDPVSHLRPAYGISPFRTQDVGFNKNLPFSDAIDHYFSARFKNRRFVYCQNGRQAICLALQHLGVHRKDIVTILTTTGNFYISGCVTREIEKLCTWNRQLSGDTRVLFVNHEFGFGYEELSQLRRHERPIIEDACLSFASENRENSLGKVGRYVVFSFSKFFPIQIGGLLVFDEQLNIEEPVDAATKHYIQKVLSYHLRSMEVTKQKRRANYQYLEARLSTFGFSPRFKLNDYSVPGVFMFTTDPCMDLPSLKTYFWNHGVECSVFYGEKAFFVPVNERLEEEDLEYFVEIVRSFVEMTRGSSKSQVPGVRTFGDAQNK